jgi:predicted ferric reductase
MTSDRSNEQIQGSSLNGRSVIVLLAAAALGILSAVWVLPNWLPGLTGSLAGNAPKVFWYLSRSTALVAMGILWASMMLGVGITNRMARLWPGAPAAFALHEYLSLLGLGFAAFHGLILLGDQYTNFNLLQILFPFSTLNYHPFWVGLGQLGFYAWAILVASFYVRKHIGQKTWRALHFISFITYLGAMVHALGSGSDTSLPWVQGFYWITGAGFLFLLIYRIINSLVEKAAKRLPNQATQLVK